MNDHSKCGFLTGLIQFAIFPKVTLCKAIPGARLRSKGLCRHHLITQCHTSTSSSWAADTELEVQILQMVTHFHVLAQHLRLSSRPDYWIQAASCIGGKAFKNLSRFYFRNRLSDPRQNSRELYWLQENSRNLRTGHSIVLSLQVPAEPLEEDSRHSGSGKSCDVYIRAGKRYVQMLRKIP